MNTEEEEAASLSLLAARVASSAERAARGASLTRQDLAVLQTMSRRLTAEAEAVRRVGHSRDHGLEPANAVAAGLTIEVILQDEAKASDVSEAQPSDSQVIEILVRIAKTLDVIASEGLLPQGSEVPALFRRVSSIARTRAGGGGERIIGRDAEFV
jgi:hypothetical protein